MTVSYGLCFILATQYRKFDMALQSLIGVLSLYLLAVFGVIAAEGDVL